MSSLTIRILSVNIIAIMILGIGILYLGQYTDSLIEGELKSMYSEAKFTSGALSEGAVRPVFQLSPIPFTDPQEIEAIKPMLARRMVRRLGNSGTSRIILFGVDGDILADTQKLSKHRAKVERQVLKSPSDKLSIGDLFDQSAATMVGEISTTAWETKDGNIILTAAAPIQKMKQVLGVVLLSRDGTELEKKIADIRVDVFRVFLGSLGITVMLSIYLSGLIGKPLKRLAVAAEAVRTGKGKYTEIPDLSNRGDEIGELSLVLRDMTNALWERMNTIERFAADVSHEIKNPLTSLRSAVETASRIKDEDKRAKLMEVINHDVRRLDRLISDISSASRLDAELTRDEMDAVNLENLLHRLRDAYKKPIDRVEDDRKANDGQINVVVENKAVVDVLGNEDRLSQVFGNLISNALSFSPADHTITLTIKKPHSKDMVETWVEAYGGHSGLGLSISKQIIDAHEGEIIAQNITDNNNKIIGARFIVRLKKAS